MMLNERRGQVSTPVVVAKDNLKQTETKSLPVKQISMGRLYRSNSMS